MSADRYKILENWISKYKPQKVKEGFGSRGTSPFVYENSEEVVRMLLSIDDINVWSLKWGSEDIFLVPGLHFSNCVGFVVTDVEWSYEVEFSVSEPPVVVETPNKCDLCGGSGEFEYTECPECNGAGEFWEEFGL